jgi:predicted membrane channel-forming protein YqfA (hemolysin III family)
MLTYFKRWPLIIHILSKFFCLSCSFIFHLCFIRSEIILRTLSRLDNGGISVLILGSSYPPLMYMLACEEIKVARNVFLAIIIINSCFCFIASMHPLFDTAKFITVRGYTYIGT